MARIAILGLGFLGTSLGLALRQQKAWSNVVGYDRQLLTQRAAQRKGAVQMGANDPVEAVRDADLVVLCGAASEVIALFTDIGPHLKPGAVVTDTASTKHQVVAAAGRSLPPAVSFVGGHPMVAGEKAGPDEASASAFQGRPWMLTPGVSAADDAIAVVGSMADVVGARAYFVDSVEHDSWSAAVEQLPAVLAAALVLSTGTSSAWRDMQRLASDAFRDTSRLVSDDPHAASDAMLTNGNALCHWIDDCVAQLQSLRTMIGAGAGSDLEQALLQGRELRDAWIVEERQGFPEMMVAMPEPSRFGWAGKALQRRRP